MNEKWYQLKRQNEDRANALATSHEVQRFFRDADETVDWINEKDRALDSDNVGSDLPSVQRLQRKHDGLERDLQAIDEKVCIIITYRITCMLTARCTSGVPHVFTGG